MISYFFFSIIRPTTRKIKEVKNKVWIVRLWSGDIFFIRRKRKGEAVIAEERRMKPLKGWVNQVSKKKAKAQKGDLAATRSKNRKMKTRLHNWAKVASSKWVLTTVVVSAQAAMAVAAERQPASL